MCIRDSFHDVPGTRITVFYPYGGVSPVQQAQMATQEGGNVRVCAVRGNFDDAQTGVKTIFAACRDRDLHGAMLSSANSINIGRLAPQVVYYFRAYGDLVKAGRIKPGDEDVYKRQHASSTGMSCPRQWTACPTERWDASRCSSATGKSRSASTFIISRPTAPVAPRMATLYFFMDISSLFHETVIEHPDRPLEIRAVHAHDDVCLLYTSAC